MSKFLNFLRKAQTALTILLEVVSAVVVSLRQVNEYRGMAAAA